MTREEHIIYAQNLRVALRMMNCFSAETMESLDVAIKALEQKSNEDCVSRQAVLESLNCEIDGTIESDIDLSKYKREFQEFANMILNAQEKVIQALPSVTPTISDIDKFNDSVNRATVLALINDVKNADGFKDYSQYDYLFDQVDEMPMATPFRKKGEWCKQNDDYFDWYECSECGYGSEGEMQYSSECDVRTKYCPNCGAEMVGAKNE
jgi:hypothetical protein